MHYLASQHPVANGIRGSGGRCVLEWQVSSEQIRTPYAYRDIPDAPSSRFFAAAESGDRAKNPSGIGGLPLARSSAAVGKTIAEYRTRLIGEAILRVVKESGPTQR
jgi:hypothetical protein